MSDLSTETLVDTSSTNVNKETSHIQSQEQTDHLDSTNKNQTQEKTSEKLEEDVPLLSSTSAQPRSAAVQTENKGIQTNNSPSESPSKGEQLTSGGYPHDNEWPRESISVICPQCDALIYTQTTTSITPTTLLIAVAEYFIEFSLFFIPLYLPPFQRLVHYCPKCQAVLGEVSELQ